MVGVGGYWRGTAGWVWGWGCDGRGAEALSFSFFRVSRLCMFRSLQGGGVT